MAVRIVGCLLVASCMHAAPPPAAPSSHPRALPSDGELANASACERRTGELRRAIARGESRPAAAWQDKLDYRVTEMLANLGVAWDAVVPLYVSSREPIGDSERARLSEVGASIVVDAGTLVSIDAPLSRLACLSELDFVAHVAAHERMVPN
jgi:hypothetical protein